MVKIFRVRTFLSSVIPALEGLPAGRQGSVDYAFRHNVQILRCAQYDKKGAISSLNSLLVEITNITDFPVIPKLTS